MPPFGAQANQLLPMTTVSTNQLSNLSQSVVKPEQNQLHGTSENNGEINDLQNRDYSQEENKDYR